ncbi:MAG: hydrolase [Gammaproteobacteria bacterium SG8_30]|jgi:putative phosphoribosyl transferase|nr:MAG: hydrolase [Gammaproteobacteria bacterium SG8_30]
MTASAGIDERALRIAAGAAVLHGDLRMPRSPAGLVLFAHGSGSSRRSVRNRFVAEILNDAGIATLLFDLLTEAEEAIDLRTRQLRFDIELLIRRLSMTTAWVLADDDLGSMPLGYFGASTGAAAALGASCEHPEVRAVVSRGGRPDLAGPLLGHVRAATLLIVGGDDYGVIELNEQALARLQCEARLEIVPGATHLFEEPGTLEQAARLAADWFAAHLPAP